MKKGLLITLIFISSLLISILFLQLSFLSTMLFSGALSYPVIILSTLSISLLTYFSLSYFNTKNITNLILMLAISIISVIPTFPINTALRNFFSSLNQTMPAEITNSIVTIFSISALINIWTFSVIVILTYNLIPIIGLFKSNSSG